MLTDYTIFNDTIGTLDQGKLMINTINAHCYNLAKTDQVYQQALLKSDVLLPDGVSIVFALKWLTGQSIKKIAGADLFFWEMERLQVTGGKCFFLGSSESTLASIEERAAREYPNVEVQSYSPPFKPDFTAEDNAQMLERINAFQPDALFVGMTAPKQEKWSYQHFNQLQVGHICSIGAVFDFYAGNISRAPQWILKMGLEWLYRLVKEPRRMWRRYLIGNSKYIWYVINEKITLTNFPALPAWLYTFSRVVIGSSELNKANVREDGIAFSDSTAQQPVSQPIRVQVSSTRVIRIREALEYWGKIPRITAFLFGTSPREEIQIPEEFMPDHLRNALGKGMSPIIPKGVSLLLTHKEKQAIPAAGQRASNAG